MAKKKKSGGGGGGDCGGAAGGGQKPKPAEEGEEKAAVVGDHHAADEHKDKDKQGKKAPPPVVTAVLKVDMHCDGCAKRIRASVRHYPGVEGVAVDVGKGTMTVVGRLDAKRLRDRVAKRTRKAVELLPNNPKQQGDDGKKQQQQQQQQQGFFKVHEHGMFDLHWLANKQQDKDKGAGGDKGSGGGKDEKSGGEKGKDKKKQPAVPVVGTVVLKIGATGLHCDGCMKRVRTKLFKIKGVEQVSMDMAKNQVTVTGTMDTKTLSGKLQKKVRRPVDVAPANKEKDKDKDKDGNTKQGGGNTKQEAGKDKDAATKALTAELEMWKTAFYDQQSLLNAELMLSDENPNACSVM